MVNLEQGVKAEKARLVAEHEEAKKVLRSLSKQVKAIKDILTSE